MDASYSVRFCSSREERRGRLFDELLVTALQRAVARRDHDDVARGIREALRLDVARLVEVLLDEALAAAEGGDRLARRRLEHLGDLFERAGDLEAASAAAVRGLDGDRQAVLLDERERPRRRRRPGPGCPGASGAPTFSATCARGDLVAERLDRLGARADPDQPGADHGAGEVGVLGEESVAGVHGVGAGAAGDREDLLDREVRVGARRAVERSRPRRRGGRGGRRGPGRRRRRPTTCPRRARRG